MLTPESTRLLLKQRLCITYNSMYSKQLKITLIPKIFVIHVLVLYVHISFVRHIFIYMLVWATTLVLKYQTTVMIFAPEFNLYTKAESMKISDNK